MNKTKWDEKVEAWVAGLAGVGCILIAVLDFSGLLENFPWVTARLPVFTLLAIGLLLAFLVTYLTGKERREIGRQAELLSNIKLDEASGRFRDTLETLWKQKERDIERIFEEVGRQVSRESDLRSFLEKVFTDMIRGDYFGVKVVPPWDFTLSAITYDGVFIYHPGIPAGVRISVDSCLHVALKERKGSSFWENSMASEQLGGLFPMRAPGNKRFTRLYFRDFPDLKAVVTFESHINIIDKLPPIAVRNLQILHAKYGANGKFNDVTKLLNSKIEKDRLTGIVSNEFLGGDPIPQIVKQLTVEYSCLGQVRSLVVTEGQKLDIPGEAM